MKLDLWSHFRSDQIISDPKQSSRRKFLGTTFRLLCNRAKTAQIQKSVLKYLVSIHQNIFISGLSLSPGPPGALAASSEPEAFACCMAIKSIRFEICSKTSAADSVPMKATPGKQTFVNSAWYHCMGVAQLCPYRLSMHGKCKFSQEQWHVDRVKAGHWLENKEEKAFLNVFTDF